jgi:hypothetical protein
MKLADQIASVILALVLLLPVVSEADTPLTPRSSLAVLYMQLVQLFQQEIVQLTTALGAPHPHANRCVAYQSPACENGTLIPQATDPNGCQLPPKCILGIDVTPPTDKSITTTTILFSGLRSPQTSPTPLSTTTMSNLYAGPPTDFSASPSSGTAPLTVSFDAPPSAASGYSVVTGDGASIQEGHGADACPNILCNTTYTYRSPGTYTATLMAVPVTELSCPPGVFCIEPHRDCSPGASCPSLQQQAMGTVTIMVR